MNLCNLVLSEWVIRIRDGDQIDDVVPRMDAIAHKEEQISETVGLKFRAAALFLQAREAYLVNDTVLSATLYRQVAMLGKASSRRSYSLADDPTMLIIVKKAKCEVVKMKSSRKKAITVNAAEFFHGEGGGGAGSAQIDRSNQKIDDLRDAEIAKLMNMEGGQPASAFSRGERDSKAGGTWTREKMIDSTTGKVIL